MPDKINKAANPEKPREPWNWDLIEKRMSVAQHIVVIAAVLCGGLWALSQFYAEGKNISGPRISVSARQIQTDKEPHLIAVNVAITGSDRRGYYYDFREAHLSVIKVSFKAAGSEPDLAATARITPEIIDLTEDGQLGGAVSHRSHIASYRKSGFSFLVPVAEPGVYLVTFTMPSSGVLDASTVDLPEVDDSDPRVLGIFAGESEAVYVTVEEAAAETAG